VQTDAITLPRHPRHWETRVAIVTVLVFGLALSGVLLFALASTPSLGTTVTNVPPPVTTGPAPYPVGVPVAAEPSGMAPPTAGALDKLGYHRVYATDFLGNALPTGWVAFTGVPGGDLNARFSPTHVIVGSGMLRLVTTSTARNRWITSGLCQCGNPMRYGAFFVRSKISNAGPNEVELLWPATNQWPPEIDFNETGSRWAATAGTVHFGRNAANDHFIQQNFYPVDLRRWHTWGVLWTPTSVTFTIDGRQWGKAVRTPGTIPRVPMTLDLQQRPGCVPNVPCPSQDQAMYVDWVAEYAKG
jgi:hypothetical protein